MILESPGEPTPEVLIVLIKAQAVEIALLKAQAEGDRAIMQKKDLHDFLKTSNGIEKRQSIGARQTTSSDGYLSPPFRGLDVFRI